MRKFRPLCTPAAPTILLPSKDWLSPRLRFQAEIQVRVRSAAE